VTSPEQKKAIAKAKRDYEKGKPANIIHSDSAVRKSYFDTYYSLRTNNNLKHVIAKYGPLK
jgi:hypothetical protein